MPRKRTPTLVGKTRGRRRNVRVHQFLIILANTDPLVWRRIQVPEEYLFWDLHVAIQDAMGWLDSHLHEFLVADSHGGPMLRLGLPDDGVPTDEPTAPDWQVAVSDHIDESSPPALYVYDFGDDWRHALIYEGAMPGEEGRAYPRCIAGANAAPPEDVGGALGFEEFKRAMKDPRHPAHEQFSEWIGGTYDPAAFDPVAVHFDDPYKRWQMAFGPQR